MIRLTIDGQEVEVAPGQTLLEAARKLQIEIPTLCYLETLSPATSCLVCLVNVKANGQGRLVPSCATKAVPGLVVESETDEVHEARRTALELLLSDHVGDCLSPCHRICPLRLNIPVMIRHLQAEQFEEAIATVKEALPMPAILGRLCHHPCENGCRRGTYDQPAAIREMERFVADHDLHSPEPYLPSVKAATGKSVAIVGAGPTGLAAAYFLLREGHACTIADRHGQPGGSLLAQVDEKILPGAVLAAEIVRLRSLGAKFMLGVELGRDLSLEGLLRGFDAVLLTPGEVTKTEAAGFGLAVTPAGLKVDPATGLTALPRVFAAGSAVKPVKQVVKAMSEGQTAARRVHQFLTSRPLQGQEKQFSSIMGRLQEGEVNLFLDDPSPTPRITPALGVLVGFTSQEAPAEAARCLHCDCRAAGHCALQHYAALYGADPGRFRDQRRRFEQHRQHGEILFEPGKCILCGICVQLAEQAREPLGLAFIGRGFDVRVGAPLNHTIAEGLQKVAAECVEHCPTGALAFKDAAAVGAGCGAMPAAGGGACGGCGFSRGAGDAGASRVLQTFRP